MKFFILLFLSAAALAAGYFLHPALYDYAQKVRPKVGMAGEVATAPKTPTKGGGTNSTAAGPGAPSQEPASIASAQTTANKVTSEAVNNLLDKMKSGDPVAPSASVSAGPAEVEDEITRRYPLPKFREITEITRDWTWMPTKAFPRRIIAKQPLVFNVAGGTASLPSGSEVSALAMDKAMVTLARTATDSAMIQVPLASTNLKELMTRLYDEYTNKMRSRVIATRQAARDAKNQPKAPDVSSDERVRLAGNTPEQDADGAVTIMVASMRKQEVTEVKPDNIKQWGLIGFHKESPSKGYWTCSVTATMSTIFGEVDTDITAWMANGKVVRWFYTGSKEPVQ